MELIKLIVENTTKSLEYEIQGIGSRWTRRYILLKKMKEKLNKLRKRVGGGGLLSQALVLRTGEIHYGYHTNVLEKAIHY